MILRPLKHHVLEEVREPRPPAPLVLRADVIPDVDRDNRRLMVFMQNDGQAVRKRVFLVRNLRRRDLLSDSRRRNGQNCEGEQKLRRRSVSTSLHLILLRKISWGRR